MPNEIVNRVASSALVTIDLEQFYPKEPLAVFDLKLFLFRELILKEKEFREALTQVDWNQYQDKWVAVYCSTDAVIPLWAYMLVACYLQPVAKEIYYGTEKEALRQLVTAGIQNLGLDEFKDKRVVIKGCGDEPIDAFAYLEISKRLRPWVKSLLYGEPCSTVPIYKAH